MIKGRSISLAVRVFAAAYFDEKPIRKAIVSRLSDEFVFLAFLLGKTDQPLLGWAFQTVHDLAYGEAIASSKEDLAISIDAYGMPTIQSQLSDWLNNLPEYIKDLVCKFQEGDYLCFIARGPEPLDPDSYLTIINDNTWVGCLAIKESAKDLLPIKVKIGAGLFDLACSKKSVLCQWVINERFYACHVLVDFSRDLIVRVFKRDGIREELRISMADFLIALGFQAEDIYGGQVDCNICLDICFDSELHKEIILKDIEDSSSRGAMREKLKERISACRIEMAKGLQERRAALNTREKIYIKNNSGSRFVGFVPRNENETVVLAARLEVYISSFFFNEFKILEYTSRQGIDAIVKIKKSDISPIHDCLTEFEYTLSNFFKHQHPIQQVDLIICWSSQEIIDGQLVYGNDFGFGKLKAEINTKGWLRYISFADHNIIVLDLSKIPGIVIN